MRKLVAGVALVLFLVASAAMADTFGTGANQFTIDFVPISGATNPTSGYGVHRQPRLPHGHLRDHQRPVEQVHGRLRPVTGTQWRLRLQFVTARSVADRLMVSW